MYKVFKDSDQTTNLSIQPFRLLWNSSSKFLIKSDEYGFFKELDDHRIHMKFFKDFDQNSGCQP